MEVTFRPLTRTERKELQGYVAWSITLFRAVLFGAAVAIVGWVLRAVHTQLARQSPTFGPDAWWILPLVAFAVALYIVSGRWTGGRALRARIRSDLKRGLASLQRIVAVDAIEIEEQEDEGPGYFILTDKGQTMLFAGQYVDRLKGKGFPWASFDIVEAPDSRIFFAIVAAGERLTPTGRRPPLTWEEAKAFGIFKEKYRILDVGFESLRGSSRSL